MHLPNQSPNLLQSGRLQWDKSIQLLEGGAAHLHVRPAVLAATHVYMFDWLFREEALSIILSVLAASSCFRLVVSCPKQDGIAMQEWGLGLRRVRSLCTVPAINTHRKSMCTH